MNEMAEIEEKPFNPSLLNWSPKKNSDILIFLDLTKFKT